MTAAIPALPPRTRTVPKIAAVTALVAIPAFVLAPMLFIPSVEVPQPTSAQLPLFMVLGAFEAIGLGLAVAVLLFGGSWFQKLFVSSGRARAAHLSVVWLLGNWWVHDNLHLVNGLKLSGLLAIEYAFHITLMAAGAVLAWVVATGARAQGSERARVDPSATS